MRRAGVRPSVRLSHRSIAGKPKVSRQSAAAASVLPCDPRDEDEYRFADNMQYREMFPSKSN